MYVTVFGPSYCSTEDEKYNNVKQQRELKVVVLIFVTLYLQNTEKRWQYPFIVYTEYSRVTFNPSINLYKFCQVEYYFPITVNISVIS